MKVAHINAGNEYGGGLVHIVSLLTELQTDGVKAELIVMEEGPVAKAARSKGITVSVFEQSNRYDLRVLNKLLSYVNSNQFDVIHTHGPRANMMINLLKPFIKVKWVVTVHSNPLLDFENQGLKGKLFERINVKSLIHADGLIAVSNEIQSIALELGATRTHLTTMQNGIKFSSPLSVPKQKDLFTVVSVGRLHAIKNFDFLLESLASLSVSNWRWVLCGSGEEEYKLRKRAEELACLPNIDFKGWVEADQLGGIISQADLMIHPSRSESFPLVLLEAAEQKVPVISTDVGDVKDLLTDPSLGWLVKSADKKQMMRALEEAYNDWTEGTLSVKGEKLREKALTFSLKAQSERVIAFYKKIS